MTITSSNTIIDSMLFGHSWGGSSLTSANVDYSLYLGTDSWTNNGTLYSSAYDAGAISSGEEFDPLSTTIVGGAVEDALDRFADVANLTFTGGAAASDSSQIAFREADLTGTARGFAYSHPNGDDTTDEAGVVFDPTYVDDDVDSTNGSSEYATILHEIGHALGLDHFTPLSGLNGSIMVNGTAEPGNQGTYANNGNVVGPQIFDIMALQFLYGANWNHNNGASTYSGGSADRAETIWDGGGHDKIDATSESSAVTIDLREGVSHVTTIGNTHYWIAYGANIEEARGGSGNDTIYGSNEKTTTQELENDPYNSAGTGKTSISGDNTLKGGNGDDSIRGWTGDDSIEGEGDSDKLFGDEGHDILKGGAGADSLFGGAGNDTLDGGAAVDFLDGGTGANTLTGGSGNDEFQISGSDTNTISDFDTANEKVHFSGGGNYDPANIVDTGSGAKVVTAAGATIYFTGKTASQFTAENFSEEGESGSPTTGNDLILGTAAGDAIDALEGDDTVYGYGGNDTLEGSEGVDYLFGGNGNDLLYGDANDDVIEGGAGVDDIFGGSGDDFIEGDAGNDSIEGDAGNDVIYGGGGDDKIYGGDGADYIDGGDGNDMLYSEASSIGDGIDILKGGEGNDAIAANGSAWFKIEGGAGKDSLYGTTNVRDNELHGGDGDDFFNPGHKNVAFLGAGDDLVSAGSVVTPGSKEGIMIVIDNNGSDIDRITSMRHGDILVLRGFGYSNYGDFQDDTITSSESGFDIMLDPGNGYELHIDFASGHWLNSSNIYFSLGDIARTVAGTASADNLHGIHGGDNFLLLGGNDLAYGYGGDDTMWSHAGNDTLYGGDGDDYVLGDQGSNDLYGEEGDDTLRGSSNGNNYMDGGNGTDVAQYKKDTVALKIDLEVSTQAKGDVLVSIEGIMGGTGDDTLEGNEQDNYLWGYLGDDIVLGREGADYLIGDSGSDVFVYESLDDSTDSSSDFIDDFNQSDDLIDVTGLGFTGIQSGAGSGSVLGYSTNGNGDTTIEDADSDFSLVLQGAFTLSASDFIFS